MPKPHSPTPDPIALEIARAITQAGINKAELAQRLGLSRSHVSRWCSPDYHGHSIKTLRAIAEALGMRLEVRFVKEHE